MLQGRGLVLEQSQSALSMMEHVSRTLVCTAGLLLSTARTCTASRILAEINTASTRVTCTELLTYAILRLLCICNTVLRQPLPALEVDTPYHVLAYVYLPKNTKCVLGADNFQCPYAWITSDGKPRSYTSFKYRKLLYCQM
jgi:hypothetical protein